MKSSVLSANINHLKRQIILKEAEYIEAIKSGKEFQEAKELYLAIKELKQKADQAIKELTHLRANFK